MLSSIGSAPVFQADFIVSLSGDWLDAVGATENGGAEFQVTDEETTIKAVALIDHELCHCDVKVAGEYVDPETVQTFREGLGDRHIETCPDITNKKGHVLVRYQHTDESGKLSFTKRRHDFEEFNGVIARYGVWDNSVAKMVDVMIEHQPSLFDRLASPSSKTKTAKPKAKKADAAAA